MSKSKRALARTYPCIDDLHASPNTPLNELRSFSLSVQDVLPLFPDFARIDAFKGALCDGLADYNAQIQGLKTQMEDATRIADALRCALSVALSRLLPWKEDCVPNQALDTIHELHGLHF